MGHLHFLQFKHPHCRLTYRFACYISPLWFSLGPRTVSLAFAHPHVRLLALGLVSGSFGWLRIRFLSRPKFVSSQSRRHSHNPLTVATLSSIFHPLTHLISIHCARLTSGFAVQTRKRSASVASCLVSKTSRTTSRRLHILPQWPSLLKI